LVAGYLQRYCVKNDSIGFFGPIGWGTFTDGPFRIEAKSELLEKRHVFFEHWPMEALATAIGSAPDLLPDLCPRKLPTVRVDGGKVTYGPGQFVEVPLAIADLLSTCDGTSSARAIANEYVKRDSPYEEEDDVYETLEELVDKGLLCWGIELPSGILDPSAALRRLFEALPAAWRHSRI